MPKHVTILAAFILTAAALVASGADKDNGHKYSVKETKSGAVITVDGQPFAEYVVDQANKPYLFPVYGPTGKQMTRAYPMKTVEGERHDHPHHRGINFGHEGIGGVDTWSEQLTWDEFAKNPKRAKLVKERTAKLGRIKHVKFTVMKVEKTGVTLVALCEYLGPNGNKVLTEERRMRFHVATGVRMIDFDQTLIASEQTVRFDDKKDAGLSIRVRTSMDVTSKMGGTIINSEGDRDKQAWSKAAKWCSYSGPVDGEQLGVAMLNHPSSFRHPTKWHVRDYGLFTANAFASKQFNKSQPDATFELKKGERIQLHHRFLFHKGDAKSADIAKAFEAYAKEKR